MFARELRLRREYDVQRARSRGKAWADGPIVFRIVTNTLVPAQNRYTVVAGKKVGKAVDRNRARRVVREALRLRHPDLLPGHDVVVIIRGTHDQLPDLATAQPIVERVLRRSGLISPGAPAEPARPGSSPAASGQAPGEIPGPATATPNGGPDASGIDATPA